MRIGWLLPIIAIGIAALATSEVRAADCPDWSPAQARQEMAALHDRLDGWNHAYRVDGQSPVDDAVYDQAQQRLAHWRGCFPAQAPAPLAHLADAIENGGGGKITHRHFRSEDHGVGPLQRQAIQHLGGPVQFFQRLGILSCRGEQA